jgi:hypothetical protein
MRTSMGHELLVLSVINGILEGSIIVLIWLNVWNASTDKQNADMDRNTMQMTIFSLFLRLVLSNCVLLLRMEVRISNWVSVGGYWHRYRDGHDRQNYKNTCTVVSKPSGKQPLCAYPKKQYQRSEQEHLSSWSAHLVEEVLPLALLRKTWVIGGKRESRQTLKSFLLMMHQCKDIPGHEVAQQETPSTTYTKITRIGHQTYK